MGDLTKLPLDLDAKAGTCRAIVETPKGARSKYDYDPDVRGFVLKALLPEGMSFPMDFGFFPSTLGEDGDPLDVQVLHDEPMSTGALLRVRLIGLIEADQTEGDKTIRNDRLVAVSEMSLLYGQLRELSQLGEKVTDHLVRFWVNYNALRGRTFTGRGVFGPDRAMAALKGAVKKAKKSKG